MAHYVLCAWGIERGFLYEWLLCIVKVCLIVLLIVTFIELNLFSFFKKK